MAQYLGLLCDLDGTLADTEPQHCDAWLKVLKEQLHLDYDEGWFEQYVGTSDYVLSNDIIAEHQPSGTTAEDLVLRKQTTFHEEVRATGNAFPGIHEALQRVVDGGYPLAIATNSGRADTDVVIPALGLDEFTKVVVTATDVEHMKPAPDIYLLAAERLGLSANNCIAIEDSNPGGDAAKAAGCYLIGLNDGVRAADIVITDNAEAIASAIRMLSPR